MFPRAALSVFCVCSSSPALLWDRQSPRRWHLPFPVVMLWRLFVQLCSCWNLCTHFRGSSFDHQKRDDYMGCSQWLKTSFSATCSLPSNIWDPLWLVFLFYFNLLAHWPLLFFALIHHLLPKFLCPVTHFIFVFYLMHFLGLYTGVHLLSLFQNATLNMLWKIKIEKSHFTAFANSGTQWYYVVLSVTQLFFP